MPLPVKVNGTNGETIYFVLENTANNQFFTKPLNFQVASVEFNYEYQIIEKNSTVAQDTNLKVDEIDVAQFALYPNPAKDILNFTLSETNTAYEYEISNMLGEKVSYGNVNSNSISIINLANGVYIVKIRTNEGVLTEKFIKE